MRIGIFPGSFNPPHDGHLAIAKNLIKLNYLDKVIFVPVSNFYVKNELLDGEFRLDMLKIATKSDDRLCVSDYEIISEAQPYTYQTLDFFKNKFKDDTICLIVGTDNYLNLISWKTMNT
ncbi:MAG: nicotinate-nicotinamide nucleotide adenylyltransferase [Bacilli bacterium]|nr:nicotinate-nicotinamide nucleotide adenylyltransferase [Bacilli bacterium]